MKKPPGGVRPTGGEEGINARHAGVHLPGARARASSGGSPHDGVVVAAKRESERKQVSSGSAKERLFCFRAAASRVWRLPVVIRRRLAAQRVERLRQLAVLRQLLGELRGDIGALGHRYVKTRILSSNVTSQRRCGHF